ncbi:MAG: type II toxin-antitoxin system RelE family toxin [Acidimicrobiales bacterium]
MVRVELVRRARQEVLDLDWPLAGAVDEALGLLERDPEAGKALRGRLRGLRSLRVGTYRVIYQLDEQHRLVRVLTVRHRAVAHRTDPR